MDTNTIHTGDAFDVLDEFPDESIHAVVTDPPYGLAFMGRDWDDFEPKEYQEWSERWARECKRVLKPGGHLLAFSGNRTHHRLFTGVEDAGFEIRDTLTWHYGSGFPKASDVSKTIDKRKDYGPLQEFRRKLEQRRKSADVSKKEIRERFGVDSRLVTKWMGDSDDPQATAPTPEIWRDLREMLDAEDLDGEWQAWRDKVGKPSPDWFDREVLEEIDQKAATGETYGDYDNDGVEITEPATDAAKKWDGWKTGLKPATEFVVMARKPFSGATVDSVLEHGTGALNIDACRVEGGERPEIKRDVSGDTGNTWEGGVDGTLHGSEDAGTTTEGRYPANVVFDETAADALDREVGETRVSNGGGMGAATGGVYGGYDTEGYDNPDYDDSGGPSRYFYTSKASRSERTNDGAIENDHPTVKPRDLMEWLVKLVTREGQTVLDPFAGSGTTCMAAKGLGREFVGIERQAKWADVARVRCGLSPDDPSVVREDGQGGLDEW